MDTRNLALQGRSGATDGLGDLIRDGLVIIKQLDAIMHNKYASDAQKLGAWTSASHVERSAERKPSPNAAKPASVAAK